MNEVMTAPTHDEALQAMNEYAELQAQIEKVESQKKLDMLKVEKRYNRHLQEMSEKSEAAANAVLAYTEANRAELFANGKKSTDFGAGKVGIKMNRAKLDLLPGAEWEDALKYWKSVNPDYVRVKEDLDKTALLKAYKDAEGDDLKRLEQAGLQIIQEEQLYIKL